MPSVRKTSSKAWLNCASRSWTRNRNGCSSLSRITRLQVLVYALTRATSDGWGSGTTVALLAGSAALLRIFRLRTLSAASTTMAIVGAVAFSEFFLLTLYLQDVLHYSAVQSG